jgi:hypothetical protein
MCGGKEIKRGRARISHHLSSLNPGQLTILYLQDIILYLQDIILYLQDIILYLQETIL